MSRGWIAVLALFLLVALPDAVFACPVCFDARDENRQAFLATTAFLSLLPIGLVGGAGLWLRRRFRAVDAQDDEESGRDALDPVAEEIGR